MCPLFHLLRSSEAPHCRSCFYIHATRYSFRISLYGFYSESLVVSSQHQSRAVAGPGRGLLEKFEVDLVLLVAEAGKLRVIFANHSGHRIDRPLHEVKDLSIRKFLRVLKQECLCALLPDLLALFSLLVQAESEHELVDCHWDELECILRAHQVTMVQQGLVQFYQKHKRKRWLVAVNKDKCYLQRRASGLLVTILKSCCESCSFSFSVMVCT